MPRWIPVSKVEDFTTPVRVVEYNGVRIAIFKLEDGFYAIEDECSHEEACLSDGKIRVGGEVQCPRHGARFDIKSGKNLSPPAVIPVKSFPTRVENNQVMIRVDD